jgi:hypothetical protein
LSKRTACKLQKLAKWIYPREQEQPNPRQGTMTQRDIYQRKAYAMRRMSLAFDRLNRATSKADREKAGYWVAMWGIVSGIRQFKLGNGRGNGNGGGQS